MVRGCLQDTTASGNCRLKCRKCLKENLLLLLLILGVLAGIALGILLKLYVTSFQQPHLHPRQVRYLYFPAEIFLRIMTYLSMPLIVTSLVSGIGYLDAKLFGEVGLRVVVYYLGTTIIAITEGFILIYSIQPGVRLKDSINTTNSKDPYTGTNVNRVDTFLDMIRNIFPDNLITATFQVHKTTVKKEILQFPGENLTSVVEHFEDTQVESINIMGITLSAIVFGVALLTTGRKGRPLFAITNVLFEVVMKIIQVLLWVYPVGTVFMIATTVVQLEDPLTLLRSMGLFVATVILGLFIHVFLILPIVFTVILRKNPYRHLAGCSKALMTAFATNNSTLTVPVTMKCLEAMSYSPRVIRFMIPVGATVNMDGTALYQALAGIFVATLNGMNPGASHIFILGSVAVLMSIGIPTAGNSLALYVIFFKALGLPLKDIALLMTFDWILGRLRTVVNVWGDCVGVAVVSKLSIGQFEKANVTDQEKIPKETSEECISLKTEL